MPQVPFAGNHHHGALGSLLFAGASMPFLGVSTLARSRLKAGSASECPARGPESAASSSWPKSSSGVQDVEPLNFGEDICGEPCADDEERAARTAASRSREEALRIIRPPIGEPGRLQSQAVTQGPCPCNNPSFCSLWKSECWASGGVGLSQAALAYCLLGCFRQPEHRSGAIMQWPCGHLDSGRFKAVDKTVAPHLSARIDCICTVTQKASSAIRPQICS